MVIRARFYVTQLQMCLDNMQKEEKARSWIFGKIFLIDFFCIARSGGLYVVTLRFLFWTATFFSFASLPVNNKSHDKTCGICIDPQRHAKCRKIWAMWTSREKYRYPANLNQFDHAAGHIYSFFIILMLFLKVTSLLQKIWEARKVTLLKFRRKHKTLIGWSPLEQQ